MVVVGSTALDRVGLSRREPKDLDIWLHEGSEFHDRADAYTPPKEVMDALLPHTCDGYASADAIYTIKCSHLAWDILWEKTKADVLWLKAMCCVLLPELYEVLKRHWIVEHGDKDFLSLKKGKGDFFNDHVMYKYDHDYLHDLVAHPNRPVYEECLAEGEDVLIDQGKFTELPLSQQVRMFREEVAVIAIERWLVHDNDISWPVSWGLSLKKVITSLTKGWATDFIVENLELFTIPEYSYFKHTLETLNIGDIMSNKVDMAPFEEILESVHEEGESLSEIVYYMASGAVGEVGVVDYEAFKVDGKTDWDGYRAAQDAWVKSIEYKHLDQEGGGEGGSEYCYGVFSLQGKTYRAEYSYYSYNGHEYDYIVDTLREVKAVEKTITVWE